MSDSISRRNFIKSTTLGACILQGGRARTKLNPRPNIVIIMADDMGFSDLNCYGSSIATPYIDRLAQNGMKFTQFYNCARCCPTRASLLTGLYPHRAGMGAMVDNQSGPDWPAYQGYLNDRCVTIAEALAPAGYHCLMSGKWHVGELKPHWPLDRGFKDYFGLIGGASSYFNPNFTEPPRNRKRVVAHNDEQITTFDTDFYMTDAIGNHAVRQLRQYAGKGQPFFQYVAFTSPHWPLHALAEDIERYRDHFKHGWDEERTRRCERMIGLGLIKPKWQLTPRDERIPAWQKEPNQGWQSQRMAVYAAQIDRMDQNIGKILRTLEESGEMDHTIIFFLADNGGCAEDKPDNVPGKRPGGADSFSSYGLGWAQASNTPFRRYKSWVHEGGISTPLIVHWRGQLPASLNKTYVGHVMDLLPTCLELAGAEYPNKGLSLDGKSLVAVLKKPSGQGHDTLYWEHEGNRAVRDKEWKLVWDRDVKRWELFNLEQDRTEQLDQSSTFPVKAKKLRQKWEAWAKQVGVRITV